MLIGLDNAERAQLDENQRRLAQRVNRLNRQLLGIFEQRGNMLFFS